LIKTKYLLVLEVKQAEEEAPPDRTPADQAGLQSSTLRSQVAFTQKMRSASLEYTRGRRALQRT